MASSFQLFRVWTHSRICLCADFKFPIRRQTVQWQSVHERANSSTTALNVAISDVAIYIVLPSSGYYVSQTLRLLQRRELADANAATPTNFFCASRRRRRNKIELGQIRLLSAQKFIKPTYSIKRIRLRKLGVGLYGVSSS